VLFIPGGANAFGQKQQSQAGRPTAPQGTSVTPAAGSKGSWVQVIASLSEDTYGLIIQINNNNVSAASRNTVLDIGIGAAASEIVIIPDLICGNAVNANTAGGGVWYFFPIMIKAGTRIAVRSNSSVVTAFNVYIEALQKPSNPSMVKAAGFVEAIGITGNDGVAVTPGTTGEGAWVSLGTTTRDCWHWQIGAQVDNADTTQNAAILHLDLAYGDATNKQIILESVVLNTTTTEGQCLNLHTVGAESRVPAGSTLYARAQHSGTIDTINMAAYGAGG
jgi:hypothetical protein